MNDVCNNLIQSMEVSKNLLKESLENVVFTEKKIGLNNKRNCIDVKKIMSMITIYKTHYAQKTGEGKKISRYREQKKLITTGRISKKRHLVIGAFFFFGYIIFRYK